MKDNKQTILESQLFEGKMFVFLKALKNKPLTIEYYKDENVEEVTAKALDKPTIVSKFARKFSIREDLSYNNIYIPGALPKIELTSLVTDRKIYQPGNEVKLAIVGLKTYINQDIDIKILCNGQGVCSSKVRLNSDGAAIFKLDKVEDEGEYEILATIGQEILRCSFMVAEYEMTTLTPILIKQETKDDNIKVVCKLMKLGYEYSGDIKVILKCGQCGKSIADERKINIKDEDSGKFTYTVSELNKLSGCCVEGPYSINIITDDGDTASVFLQGTKKFERKEVTVSYLGDEYKATMNDKKGGSKVRGITIWKDKAVNSIFNMPTGPVAIKNNGDISIDIKSFANIKTLQILSYNPLTGKRFEYAYDDIKKGYEIELPIEDKDAPVMSFYVGAFLETKGDDIEPFESSFVAFIPNRVTLEIEVPEEVKPSDEIDVVLKSNGKCTCVLAVVDARMERDDIEKNIASQMFKSFENIIFPTLKGKDIPSFMNKVMPKTSYMSTFIGASLDDGGAWNSQEETLTIFNPNIMRRDSGFKHPNRLGLRGHGMSSGQNVNNVSASAPASFSFMASSTPDAFDGGEEALLCYADSGEEALLCYADSGEMDLDYGVLDSMKCSGTITLNQKSVAVQEKTIQTQVRAEFKEVLFFDMFELDGKVVKTIRLADQVGTWKVYGYVLSGIDFVRVEKEIYANKKVAIDVDVPSFIGDGDEVMCAINFNAQVPVQIAVMTNDKVVGDIKAAGVGRDFIKVNEPGIVAVAIKDFTEQDAVIKTIAKPAVAILQASEIMIPKAGEEVKKEGDDDIKRIVIFPKPIDLQKNVIEGLLEYPHGCGEQTSAKLKGLAYGKKAIDEGMVKTTGQGGGDDKLFKVDDMIQQGLNRMQSNFRGSDGSFGMWHNGGDVSSTAQIAKNLAPYNGMGIPLAQEMLNGAVGYLKAHKHKDNELAFIDKDMAEGKSIKSVEDAVVHYTLGDKEDALEYIKSKALKDKKGNLYWQSGGKSWAGSVESTAKAAKALYLAREFTLFKQAFDYITGFMENGRLYSTTDTCAFIELLDVMNYGVNGNGYKAIVDGKEMVVDRAIECEAVKVVDEGIMVRVDRDVEIDYKEVNPNFEFEVSMPTDLKVGERAKLVIKPKEKSRCPITKVFLSANLCMVKGGCNIQSGVFPIKEEFLELDVVAIRRGTAGMYVVMMDMYDKNKVGVSQRLPIKVA